MNPIKASQENSESASRKRDRLLETVGHIHHLWWALSLIGGAAAFLVNKFSGELKIWQLSIANAILVGATIGFIITFLVAVYLIRVRIKPQDNRTKYGDLLRKIIEIAYATHDLSSILIVQYFLRLTLVVFIALPFAIYYNNDLSEAKLLANGPPNDIIGKIILLVTASFLVSSTIFVIIGIKRCKLAVTRSDKSLLNGTLWLPTAIDCIYIFFSSILLYPTNELNFAYIIPVIGAWVLSRPGGARYTLFGIAVAIVASFVVGEFKASSPSAVDGIFSFNLAPGIVTRFGLQLVAPLAFWSALALPLLILRTLHIRETAQKSRLENEKRILDIVTENIDYSVFMKDSNRRFVYANGPMARRLKLARKEIIGKTDWDLGIDCSAYLDSDTQVLCKKERVRAMEPNFDKDDCENPTIFTLKTPIVSSGGDCEGYVGMCEPGTPTLIRDSSARLFEEMPYYATLKDLKGFIKWVNPAFCESDVGRDRNEILKMNDGRGATDFDIYDQELALRFRQDDSDVIKSAEIAFRNGDNPTISSRKVYIEEHIFPARNLSAKVKVTKIPWIDAEKKEVLGVIVFYHEI